VGETPTTAAADGGVTFAMALLLRRSYLVGSVLQLSGDFFQEMGRGFAGF